MTITTLSCTSKIYRGEVTFVDNQDQRLIELYGTNQSIWSGDSNLGIQDVVEIETKNDFKKYDIKFVCSPVEGHCHFNGSGVHKRMHIRMLNQGSGSSQGSMVYNGTNYIAAEMQPRNSSQVLPIWVEENFDFNGPEANQLGRLVYGLLLEDQNSVYQYINGRVLLIDYDANHNH